MYVYHEHLKLSHLIVLISWMTVPIQVEDIAN